MTHKISKILQLEKELAEMTARAESAEAELDAINAQLARLDNITHRLYDAIERQEAAASHIRKV